MRIAPGLSYRVLLVGGGLRHLARPLDELLDVSRITRGKLTLQKETVELRDVAR